MPWSERTRKIDDEEWESRKTEIVRLYRDQKLLGDDGVIKTMARQGFVATKSQYEYRLRGWGIHKYRIQKPQRSRHQIATPQQEAESVSPVFENANQPEDIQIAVAELDTSISFDQNTVAAATTTQYMEAQGVASSRNVQFSGETDLTRPNPNIMEFTNANPTLPSPSSLAAAEFNPTTPQLNLLLSGIALPPFDHSVLAELTSGLSDSNDFTGATPTPVNDSGSTELNIFNYPPTISSASRNGYFFPSSLPAMQLAAMIINDVYRGLIAKFTSNTLAQSDGFSFICNFSNIVAESDSSCSVVDIRVPNHLYSRDIFVGEDWSQLSNIPEAIFPDAIFEGRLIASMINGFGGLGSVPHVGVLKFLLRNSEMQRGLFQHFDSQSSSLTKSFAENIFIACVESDNINAVQFLINKKLVDANEAVCHFQGERYTPLQSAAIHQSLEVVKFLVGRVDVNKSLSQARQSNSLDLLIRNVDNRQSTLDEGFLHLVEAFLIKGAIISVELIDMVLASFVDQRLIARLLKDLASQTLRTLLLRKSLLQNAVRDLVRQDLIRIIELIHNNCQNSGGGWYMYQFHQQVDNAFRKAVNEEYNELSELMLPYTSSPHKALEIAKEAKNQVAIRFIRGKYPELNVDLGFDGATKDSDMIIHALKSKNQDVLRDLETVGVFDRLRGHELGQVLTKALEEGNREYATKILSLDPDFKFYDDPTYDLYDSQILNVSSAFGAALAHDFQDIAWKLLSVGLTAMGPHFSWLRSAPLLLVAVEEKRPEFVKAILGSGLNRRILSDDKWPILESAMELSEASIFDALWNARPSPCYPTERLLELALEKGREELFLEMVNSYPNGPLFRDRGLTVAVKHESASLLNRLVSLGVSADNEAVLQDAIVKHPSMVQPLLQIYWNAYPQGRVGYGRKIIWNVLDHYPKSFKGLSLDQIVTWNLLSSNHLLQGRPGEETLLAKAIKIRKCAIVKKFIDADSNIDSNVNITMTDDWHSERHFMTTSLLVAIQTNIEEIVLLLLKHNANVNEPAQNGITRTPLQKAAEINNTSIVKLLLEYGADVNATPAMFQGATALQFAAINGNCDIAKILIEHGARADIPPPRGIYGRWPLEGAAENGRFDMIELLWNNFGPFPLEQCQCAMWRAERNGRVGCKEKIQELMARSTATNSLSWPMTF